MEEEKRTAAALTEKPARALVATLEVLKLTCCDCKSAIVKERREESQCVSIADVKKKRDDPKERER